MTRSSTAQSGGRYRGILGLTALVLMYSAVLVGRFGFPGAAPQAAHAQQPPAVEAPAEPAPSSEPAAPAEPAAHSDTPPTEAAAEHGNEHADAHGEEAHGVPDVAWYWMLPFVLLLGSIAVMPLLAMHFWHHYYHYVAIGLGLITAIYYLFIFKDPHAASAWVHEMQEYVSFIALLASLYVVSGGIVIHVSRKATPLTNTMLLLIGAILANVVGTTGAAMLLIRPYIRINRKHIKPYHVVFFIFIVANCGGSLTPIGDPPLFMGFLKGVPFFWVIEECWPMWAVAVLLLLAVFFVLDTRDHEATEREHHAHDAGPAVEIFGFQNFLWIGMILVGVFQQSVFEAWHKAAEHGGIAWAKLLISREPLMFAALIISKLTTKPFIYERNEFTYGPIKEVAWLFVGIFSTMVPALNYLNNHADQMPLKTAGQYYWLTGSLSAVLDNAPTYLVFLETKRGSIDKSQQAELATLKWVVDEHAEGKHPADGKIKAYYLKQIAAHDGPSEGATHGEATEQTAHDDADAIVDEIDGAIEQLEKYHRAELRAGTLTAEQLNLAFLIGHPIMGLFLVAISVGAVFFGAMTYIGNGPNFMVKSIAESSGIVMPSFFGYIARYSLPILLPIYLAIWLVFFVFKW